MTINSEEKSAGRGRKQCPACKKYVGVRTLICTCSHEFGVAKPKAPAVVKLTASKKPKLEEPEEDEPEEEEEEEEEDNDEDAQPEGRVRRIWTPAGGSPAKLGGTSREEVHCWAEKIRKSGFNNGLHYLVQAVLYWAREFYDINGPDYQIVRAHLYNLYPYEAASR